MNKKSNIISLISILAIFIFASCDKIDSKKDEDKIEPYLSKSIVSSTEGYIKLEFYDKGLSWDAVIVEGEDVLSFSLSESKVQTSGVVTDLPRPNFIYLYYSKNNTSEVRTAKIKFTYDNGSSYFLDFTQKEYVGGELGAYLELPEKIEGKGYYYVTHDVTVSGKKVRNFSMCFDPKSYAALWVAYPYHNIYVGKQKRTDDWRFDPKIPNKYQPNLYRSYGGDYDRGHQLGSADRTGNREMNAQTFYYSNMTPQLDRLNQQKWADLEIKVRDNVCSDTLYVVTGADYSTSIGTTTDAAGKVVPLPGGYYKVLLRTKSGRIGKSIRECKADDLMAIAFYFDHRYYSSIPEAISVDEVEKKTGFNFFPGIDESVESRVNINDWDF